MLAGNLHAQSSELEIMTLFTTQQERELINKNRYKKQQPATVAAVPEKAVERKEVKLSIRLAGVTISQSGENVAWLNGKALENGSELDDGSKVIISEKAKTLVQIKTPDGHYHSVTAGETIEVSYFKIIEG